MNKTFDTVNFVIFFDVENELRQIPNDPRKTKQLVLNVCLAAGERTQLVLNIRTEDGMTNGARNIVKFVQQSRPSGIVWVQFDHSDTVQKTRNENRYLYTQPCVDPNETSYHTIFCGSKQGS